MLSAKLACYGLDGSALVSWEKHRLETDTLAAFLRLRAAAKGAGFELKICSAYRDFARQQHIWDQKAQGLRPVLDANNQAVTISQLPDDKLIDLILLWSAIPGTSRHHWGTDLDVFDAAQISQQALQLNSSEYQDGGPCQPLYLWLKQHAADYGFYFPYQQDLSGVRPEPWHISYYPKANALLEEFDTATLFALLGSSDITLKHALLPRLPQLVDEYVRRVAPSP